MVVGPHVPRHVVDPIAKDCNSTVVEAYPDQPTPPSVSAASMPAPPVSHSSSASSLSAADTDYDVENSKIVRTAIEYLYNNDILLSPSRHEKAALQDALDVGIAQRPACRFQLKTVHVPVPVPVSVPGESKGIGETSTAVDAIQASTEPLNVDSVPVPVVLDVAHNADALTALMKMLVRRRDQIDQTRTSRTTSTPNGPPKIRLVMGLCQEKSMNDCFEALIKEHTTISSESIGDGQTNTGVSISGIHLVQANTARAATLDALKEAVKTAAQNQCSSNVACRRDTGDSSADHVIDEQYFFPVEAGVNGGNVTATIRAALSESARVNANVSHGEEREIVVVCGSVFLMTESRQALGIPQPLDPM